LFNCFKYVNNSFSLQADPDSEYKIPDKDCICGLSAAGCAGYGFPSVCIVCIQADMNGFATPDERILYLSVYPEVVNPVAFQEILR
jgi:hypothetical protein